MPLSPVSSSATTVAHTNYDSPWKDIIEAYFEQFILFFFAQAHVDIDWPRGYEFLDKELQQVVREAEAGRTVVDKLVKVWLNDGTETWLLIHVEVQSQAQTDFSLRMFTYNYRLFDRYQKEVVSFAVLADGRPSWRPTHFGYGRWGTTMGLTFATTKLLDFNRDWAALEQSTNPFAIVVMAHLKTQATHRQWEDRLRWKIYLLKFLYARGYTRNDVLELLRFIDWIMILPAELEENFRAEVAQIEEAQNMQYITTWERQGIERGIEQGIEQGIERGIERSIIDILETRFGPVPSDVVEQIQQLHDHEQLRRLLKQAVLVDSLDSYAKSISPTA